MRHGMCTAVVGHRVYVFGGHEKRADSATWHFSVIDSAQDFRWTHVEVRGPQPTGRRNLSCWLHKDSVYIFGGDSYRTFSGRTIFYGDLWSYDTVLNTFEKVETSGAELGKRSFLSVGFIESREECVFYGGWSAEGVVANPRCLDMRTLKAIIPKLTGVGPGPRARHGTCVVDKTLYLMGGSGLRSSRSLSMLHCDIPRNFRWSQVKASFPGQHQHIRGNTTLTACGSRIYYLGGLPSQTDATLYFSSKKGKWELSGNESRPAPETHSHLSVYVNRTIFVYGGFPQNASLSVWILSAA